MESPQNAVHLKVDTFQRIHMGNKKNMTDTIQSERAHIMKQMNVVFL